MSNKTTINIIVILIFSTAAFIIGYYLSLHINKLPFLDLPTSYKKIERTLDKYSIENLSKADFSGSYFEKGDHIKDEKDFGTYLFKFKFKPNIADGEYKTSTGIINYPVNNENNKYPLVVMIRGYVDQNIYTSGMGTKNFSEYLAKNEFVTISPDFLGYGGSDTEAGNIFESRFQTYTTILSLLNYIETIGIPEWDGKNLYLWGHSNGGHIALIVLEVTGKTYPTVLWAPVTKPFPYSVLYYTDESNDHGKFIRSELAKFENMYDAEKYSPANYLDRITASIQLHQGTLDEAVPVSWSDSLVKELKVLKKNIEYIKHYGADHNLRPDWDNAAKQSLDFFKSTDNSLIR